MRAAFRQITVSVLAATCALALACGGSPSEPCPGPFRSGGDITPPIKIFSPSPQYTEEARLARIQGVVIMEMTIGCRGEVTNVVVLQGLSHGLTEAAVEAAYRWQWEPATRDGRPVSVVYNVTVSFQVQ